MADDKKNTIIIKKIKKGGHGHHGGAWKVAYADFVTAMMAFFLLLWLLSSTPKETLTGISEYFQPTLGLKDGLGIGFKGGTAPIKEGVKNSKSANSAIEFSAPSKGSQVKLPEESTANEAKVEIDNLTKLQQTMQSMLQQDPSMKGLGSNVNIEMTPEGLKITILDQDKFSMFKPASAEIEENGKIILNKITDLIKDLPQYITITGHTDKSSAKSTGNYTNWELSADRSNSARRYMNSVGMKNEQVVAVIGKADLDPLNYAQPNAPQNRRITIILLKQSALPNYKKSVPDIKDPAIKSSSAMW